MSYATYIFRHSKKLKRAFGLSRHDHVILVRWLSSDAFPFTNGRDDILKRCQPGHLPQVRREACNGYTSTTTRFNHSCSSENPSTVTHVGVKQRKSTITNMRLRNQLVGRVLSSSFSRYGSNHYVILVIILSLFDLELCP